MAQTKKIKVKSDVEVQILGKLKDSSGNNYPTSDYVTDAINKAQLSGGDIDIDLSIYATKADIKDFITAEEIPSEYITEGELDEKGYATESYVDEAIKNVQPGGGGAEVSWNQIQTSGTKIATIKIGDATATDVYAPTPNSVSDGKDGVSATHTWDGTTLSITSASGTSSADLKGDKGDPGDDGDDGVSASHSWDGTTLTITSASGTSSANLKGEKGDPGTSITILGSYASEDALNTAHPTGNIGDGYLVAGNLYVWSAVEGWVNVGNIQGPKGKDGEDGVSATHTWDGTTLSITSASGTSSADLKGDKGDPGDDGTEVSWNQIQTSGTKIATISIGDTDTDIYAPSPDGVGGGDNVSWDQIKTDGEKIATITINDTDTDIYAPDISGLEQRVEEIERDYSSINGFYNYMTGLAENPENDGKVYGIKDETIVPVDLPTIAGTNGINVESDSSGNITISNNISVVTPESTKAFVTGIGYSNGTFSVSKSNLPVATATTFGCVKVSYNEATGTLDISTE